MKDIEEHVVPYLATHWRQLGKLLNIDQNSTDILQHDHPNNCKECCSRMLDDWLQENKQEDTTWEILMRAIDKLPTGTVKECKYFIKNKINMIERYTLLVRKK